MSEDSNEVVENKNHRYVKFLNENPHKSRLVLYSSAFLIRLVFIAYSFYHNMKYDIKYSDIDYLVYSDSAKYVVSNKSPYLRHTYRYTPLLAFSMVFNELLFHDFGKILFSLSDVLVGYFIDKSLNATSQLKRLLLTSLWLFNPFVIGISTRGSSDTFICLLVVATLYYHMNGHYIISSLLFGFSVHFKMYPVIYSVPFLFSLYSDRTVRKIKSAYRKPLKFLFKFPYLMIVKLKFRHVLFGLLSFSLFSLLTYGSFFFYGFESLFESYLYHYVRKDHRHNFSLYFNLMYYIVDKNVNLNFLISFVPQMFSAALFSFVAFIDLPLSLFLMSLSFVVLNKVITSQYFLWWVCFLPFVFNNISYKFESLKSILISITSMFIFKFLWLFLSFRQEHLGHNSFSEMLFSSTFLFISKMFLLWSILYESGVFKNPNDPDASKTGDKNDPYSPTNRSHMDHLFNNSFLNFNRFVNKQNNQFSNTGNTNTTNTNKNTTNNKTKTNSNDTNNTTDATSTSYNNNNATNKDMDSYRKNFDQLYNNSYSTTNNMNDDDDHDHNHTNNDNLNNDNTNKNSCSSCGHNHSSDTQFDNNNNNPTVFNNHYNDHNHEHNFDNFNTGDDNIDMSEIFKPLMNLGLFNFPDNFKDDLLNANNMNKNNNNNNNTNDIVDITDSDLSTDRSGLGELKSLNQLLKNKDASDQTDVTESTEDTADVHDLIN